MTLLQNSRLSRYVGHKLSPESKILFFSQESSADVVQEALSLGALGCVVKTTHWLLSKPLFWESSL
jgi:hypothetical protein